MTDQDPSNRVITPQVLQGASITAAKMELSSPLLSIDGNGTPKVVLHRDGRLEFGDDYNPDAAARAFWDAIQRLTPDPMTQEFGAPLKARINAELAAGEKAQKQVEAITEAVILWRDRPGGDIGLAISLANILDTEQPEPPAATALVRVLKECDRLERAVRNTPQDRDFDGAYLAAVKHIRNAAKGTTEGE
jgi:hypothetical protein